MTVKRIFYFFILLFISLVAMQSHGATSAADKNAPGAEQMLIKADQSRNSLLASAKNMNYRQNWLNCISRYEEIFKKYPKTDQAPRALYQSGVLYRKLFKYSALDEDLDNALAMFERVIDEYDGHSLADDAQYQRGEIYYREKNDPTQAYVEFLKLDIKFPSGDMTPKAKGALDELAVKLGKKESIKEETTASPSNGLITVKNIRYWATPTYTRVVIDADTPVKYTSSLIKEDVTQNKPRRLNIDLENSRVSSDIETKISKKDGLLQGARAGQYKQDIVRVVLDINSIGEYKIFPLYDPFRIVIDIQAGDAKEVKEVKEVQKETAQKSGTTRTVKKGIAKPEGPDSTVSLARQLGLTVKRIVIDPGHGGKDPGCDFDGGIQEKDIVLDLAKRLAAKIEKQLGCEVLLTRDKDVFVPLDERTAFANVNKADLFISLHVNAHKQSSIYGLETYFLNMATDERAVMVAARENATSEKNISDLQSILNDLMLNTKISESSKLAYQIQNGMMAGIKKTYKTNKKSLGVKQAPFYVLIGAEMQAVLVEIGFITNPTERKRILSDSYKNLLADGITSGITSYKKSLEPAKNTGG